jgi:dihydroxyacetone kinase-like protein
VAATLSVEVLKAALVRIAAKMETSADELNQLDAALGDGDLGVTMLRGTRAIVSQLAALPDDLGLALMACAQAFTKTSGSTLGTLIATGLMAAAKITKGRSALAWGDLSGLFDEAVAAMARRGKSQIGDKTVLDALDGVGRAIDGCDDPDRMLTAAVEEVNAVLERFRSQPARQGRARIFADKTIGRDDPGMIAIQRMLEGLGS